VLSLSLSFSPFFDAELSYPNLAQVRKITQVSIISIAYGGEKGGSNQTIN
jgi:hypothetical protein